MLPRRTPELDSSRISVLALALLGTSFIPAYALDGSAASRAAESKDGLATLEAMNSKLFPVYDHNIEVCKKRILATCPIIMAPSERSGGCFTLYRPGHAPVDGPPVPRTYDIVKDTSHSALATYEILAPYMNTPNDLGWLQPLTEYREKVRNSLHVVDALDVTSEQRSIIKEVLTSVLAFQDNCIARKSFSEMELQHVARSLGPDFLSLIDIGASIQVTHWLKVLEQWKTNLGNDWPKAYGIADAHFVTRQNNLFFSILVQAFGEDTINDRLILLQSDGGSNTADKMIDSLARIVSDRELSQCFFNDKFMMDSDLLGCPGRKAITAEASKRGTKALLPPLVPFNSHQWPWRVDSTSGSGAADFSDLKF